MASFSAADIDPALAVDLEEDFAGMACLSLG
jgi:hypothetical protein